MQAVPVQAAEQRITQCLSLDLVTTINLVWWQPAQPGSEPRPQRAPVSAHPGRADLDNVALIAVVRTRCGAANPKNDATLLASPRKPEGLFALQLRTLDSGGPGEAELLAGRAGLLPAVPGATRLILVSNIGARVARLARLRYDNAGTGKITGLGFYIDQKNRWCGTVTTVAP